MRAGEPGVPFSVQTFNKSLAVLLLRLLLLSPLQLLDCCRPGLLVHPTACVQVMRQEGTDQLSLSDAEERARKD